MKTECPYCHTALCRSCLQTYALNDISDTLRCVNPDCGHGWERDFLDNAFSRVFRLGTYKEHREKVLMDREKARLPSTQEDASAYREAKILRDRLLAEAKVIEEQIAALRKIVDPIHNRCYHAQVVIDSFGRRRMPAPNGETTANTIEHVTQTQAQNQTQTFIRPCPAPDCKGYLSTAWKCGLCNLWTCPDCHELKGPNREGDHTCTPENIATAAMITRESKPCPKCGVRICKIDGCDQMWCTACNTAFHWRTGKIAEGPVHNPHYFAWLQRQGLTPQTANAAAAGPCDENVIDRQVIQALTNGRNYLLYRDTRRPPAKKLTTEEYLGEIWRLMREAQDPYGQRRETDGEELFRGLRVQYMAGDLKEEDWKVALQRHEKDQRFQRAKTQIRDVFAGGARDLIRQVVTPETDKENIRVQVEALVTYCNESNDSLGKLFGRKIAPIRVLDAV